MCLEKRKLFLKERKKTLAPWGGKGGGLWGDRLPPNGEIDLIRGKECELPFVGGKDCFFKCGGAHLGNKNNYQVTGKKTLKNVAPRSYIYEGKNTCKKKTTKKT